MNENEFENVTPEAEDSAVEETPVETEDIVPEDTYEEIIPEELANETAEEVSEEDNLDETTEEAVEEEVNSETMVEEIIEEQPQEKKNSKKAFKVILIIVLILAVILGAVFVVFGTGVYNKLGLDKSEYGSFTDLMHNTVVDMTSKKSSNKYNNLGYVNPEGRTIQDICDSLGITLEEFLETYSLPEDMPADTDEMAAYYLMPVKVFAQMYGVDFATFKEAYSIPDETTPDIPRTIGDKINQMLGRNNIQPIDENTPWGIVFDELKLGDYVGEENLEEFKEFYGITDEITGETRYKEVKRAVDKKTIELVAEAKAAEETADYEEAETETEIETETETDIETEESAE